MNEYLRTFKPFDIEDVRQHLLIMGDLSADCAACRRLGIDGYTARQCPECGTDFRYVTSRRMESNPGERFQLARRLHEKRGDLILIDYTDYTKVLGQKKARDFFA